MAFLQIACSVWLRYCFFGDEVFCSCSGHTTASCGKMQPRRVTPGGNNGDILHGPGYSPLASNLVGFLLGAFFVSLLSRQDVGYTALREKSMPTTVEVRAPAIHEVDFSHTPSGAPTPTLTVTSTPSVTATSTPSAAVARPHVCIMMPTKSVEVNG